MINTKFILILNAFWAIPIVFIIRLINKFKKFRIIKIRSDRFGHFVPDGAEQIARYQTKKNQLTAYIFDWQVCNKQWAKMLSKGLPIHNWLRSVYFWNNYITGGEKINQTGTKTRSRDIDLLYSKFNVKLPFEKNDEENALGWLTKKGWQKGELFYCILIRDNAYLEKTFKNTDSSYHNYRNTELDTYNKAINWLVEKDVWVLRIGKIMNKPLSIKHKKIIDLPFEKKRSDLLDVWLLTNCNGCISTGTGPDILSSIYGKNVLFLNFIPLFSLRSDLKSITYPKKLIWEKDNIEFTIDEYISNNRMHDYKYHADGIKIIDMTEYEILEVTKEFYLRNMNKFDEKIKYKKKEKYFWKKILLENRNHNCKVHHLIHPNSKISTTWLKKFR